VTYGERHRQQCAEIAAIARSFTIPGPVVVCGDFNADRALSVAHLGAGFVAAEPAEPALPTRPRTGGSGSDQAPSGLPATKSSTIDHLIALRGRAVDVQVVHGRSLSDHNPVVARVLSSGLAPAS